MNGFSPEENRRFGHRLALARAKAGYSQTEFAQAMNFSQTEIALYENGKRFPSDETFKKLAEAVHVDPYWLKYGEYDAVEITTSEDGTELRLFHPKGGKSWMPMAELTDLGEESQGIAQSVINALALRETPEIEEKALADEQAEFKAELKKHHTRVIRNDPNKLKKTIKSIADQYFPDLSEKIGPMATEEDTKQAASLLRSTIEKELPDLADSGDDLADFKMAKKLLAKKARGTL